MKEKEVWRDIEGYEGLYQVSNLGRVKRVAGVVCCGKYYRKQPEKILRMGYTRGYCCVGLSKNGIVKRRQVHQLVAEAFLGHERCGFKYVVDHINHATDDNRLSNLRILTNRENCNHRKVRGTSEFVGVSKIRGHNRWSSNIQVNGVDIYLGRFESEEDAAKAYRGALENVRRGRDVVVYRKEKSETRGITWDGERDKWSVRIRVGGKLKRFGRYSDFNEALGVAKSVYDKMRST